jgi:hypothetical protein
LSAALKAVAGANFTLVEAAMGTASPVRGFRPKRAARDVCEKVPKPNTVTRTPERAHSLMVSNNASTAASAVRLSTEAASATLSTNPLLFTKHPPRVKYNRNENGFALRGQAFQSRARQHAYGARTARSQRCDEDNNDFPLQHKDFGAKHVE